jgi:hypothetical protein
MNNGFHCFKTQMKTMLILVLPKIWPDQGSQFSLCLAAQAVLSYLVLNHC